MFIPGLGNIKKYFQTVKYVMKVPINFGKYILMSGKNYTILKIIILRCLFLRYVYEVFEYFNLAKHRTHLSLRNFYHSVAQRNSWPTF